ncbi:TPA: hypothetical protein HHA48_005062 [Escherichia coli]|nr:hypothetical protein [Salmonella enterica subsp. enterica serovar Enteritidis]HAG9521009.1 hypothetical protein [Escherichia coli]
MLPLSNFEYKARRSYYLMRFRACRKRDTLEKVYQSMLDRNQVPECDYGAFESAADHRRAEIVSGKLWDKVPSHVWRYVD